MTEPQPLRWRMLGIGALCTGAFAMFYMGGLTSLAPYVRETFDLSLPAVGLMVTAHAVGTTFGLVPVGLIADKLGERYVFAVGSALVSLVVFAISFASGYAMLLVGIVLAALVGSGNVSASARTAMGWFPAGERGRALGLRQTAIPVGGAVGSLTLPFIAEGRGLQYALLVVAGVTLMSAIVAGIWMRDPPQGLPPVRGHTAGVLQWRLGFVCLLLAVCYSVVLAFIAVFLHEERHISVALASLAFAAVQVLSAAVRIGLGWRSDHTGRRVPLMRGVAAAMAVLFVVCAVTTDAPGAVVYPVALLAGILALAWNGLAVTIAAESAGSARAGMATGFVISCITVGTIVSPALFGVIVEEAGWHVGFAVVAIAPALAWLVLGPMDSDERRRRAEPLTRTAVSVEVPLTAAGG